jgi:hypothetical protein
MFTPVHTRLSVLGLAIMLASMDTTVAEYLNKTAAELPGATRSPAAMLPDNAPGAFPRDEPLLTLLHYADPASPKHVPEQDASPFIKRLNINHVWGWNGNPLRPTNNVHLINQTYRPVGKPNENELMYVYLRTDWAERGDTPLTLDLLNGYYKGRFRLPTKVDGRFALKVEEQESRAFLPPQAYSVDQHTAVLTLSGGAPGKTYRAIFLAADKGFNLLGRAQLMSDVRRRIADGTVPSVKSTQFKWLDEFLSEHPRVAVIRPTAEIFDRFDKLADPVAPQAARLPIHSRNAFWQGMSPLRLERFEQLYGRPFDPRWILDHGFGEFGFVPEEGYRQWVDLIRADLHVYARERNNLVHRHGRRIRVFYGDNYVGLVPHLNDVTYNGYDELVTSMGSGPGSVRAITSFPGRTRRIVRFEWSDLKTSPATLRKRFRRTWRWMKRELLFQCPDGLTMGGLGTGLGLNPLLADETDFFFRDFRNIFERLHGQKVFTHAGFNVYILNAWGNMAAWNTKVPYVSQHSLHRLLVDLPINVRWLSFDEVIEGGVPSDATVLLLCGEPGTAWGGGRYWQDARLVRSIQSFVENGGGLVTMGAPTLVDGRLALGGILGVEYAGAANDESERQLWNINRWSMDGRDPKAYPRNGVMPVTKLVANVNMMSLSLREHLDKPQQHWAIRYPARLRAAGAAVIATEANHNVDDDEPARVDIDLRKHTFPNSNTGVFLHQAGKGRAVAIGGFGSSVYDLLKPLLFYAGGRLEDLDRLNSGSRHVAVYYYPATKLLIAYNHAAATTTTDIRFDPGLAGLGNGRVRLTSLDGDIASIERDAITLRDGFPATLRSGQAAYWTVGRAPGSSDSSPHDACQGAESVK